MKKLIIVADDFGLSEAYSIGAIKAYKEGVVTALSLMPNMEAAPFAVDLWKKECPQACLVQHTNFVQGKPVSKELKTIVNENGEFYRSSEWKAPDPSYTKCTGTIVVSHEDVKKETLAQLNRFKELTGSYPVHVEGHSVVTQDIVEAIQEVAQEVGIHGMCQKETDTMHYAHELVFDGVSEKYSQALQTHFTAELFMEDIGGVLTSPYEYNVLHFHPGYIDAFLLDHTSLTLPRVRDLEMLTDPRVRQWLKDHEIELVDFRDIYK